jgi:competence protein ComEA
MADRSRAQLAGYALAAVLLVVAAVKLGLVGGHRGAGVPPAPVRVDRAAGGEAGAGGGGIYVHVAGAVRRPGLYRLSTSARVAMAIRRAGGGTRRARLDGVNLAARVQDGQQVVVPGAGSASSGGTGGGGGGGKPSLGTATTQQLDDLDGIGPTLAKRIVEYRKTHGGFRSIDDLRAVEGIGEKRLAALREAVNP